MPFVKKNIENPIKYNIPAMLRICIFKEGLFFNGV